MNDVTTVKPSVCCGRFPCPYFTICPHQPNANAREAEPEMFSAEWLFKNCRIVFFPRAPGYPIEHNPHALGYDKTGDNFKCNVRAAIGVPPVSTTSDGAQP